MIKELHSRLSEKLITGKILLSKFSLLSENSKKIVAYSDSLHYPFYFYLGELIQPKNVLEIGFGIGLTVGCFFLKCRSVEHFLATHEIENNAYDVRVGLSNLRRVYRKTAILNDVPIDNPEFIKELEKKQWDLVIIDQETNYDRHLFWLETVWAHISPGGILVQDHVNSHKACKQACKTFCDSRGVEGNYFRTTYGICLMQKV